MTVIKIDGHVDALLSNIDYNKVAQKSIATLLEDYCNNFSDGSVYITVCVTKERSSVIHRVVPQVRRSKKRLFAEDNDDVVF
ncbi:MAG: hypothetical protein ACRCXT_00575 [Paraclostridium sp.]